MISRMRISCCRARVEGDSLPNVAIKRNILREYETYRIRSGKKKPLNTTRVYRSIYAFRRMPYSKSWRYVLTARNYLKVKSTAQKETSCSGVRARGVCGFNCARVDWSVFSRLFSFCFAYINKIMKRVRATRACIKRLHSAYAPALTRRIRPCKECLFADNY